MENLLTPSFFIKAYERVCMGVKEKISISRGAKKDTEQRFFITNSVLVVWSDFLSSSPRKK